MRPRSAPLSSAVLILAAWLSASEGRAEPNAAQPYQRAVQAYRADQFEAALESFREAYALDPAPTLLFNIAQCEWKLGRDQEALATYERYLELDPHADNRAEVEQRIAQLRGRLPAPSGDAGASLDSKQPDAPDVREGSRPEMLAAGEPQRDTSTNTRRHLSALHIAAYATGTIAAGLLVTGVAYGARGRAKEEELSGAPIYDPAQEAPLRKIARVHYATLGAGAGLALAAVVLGVVAATRREPRVALGPVVSSQAVVLTAQARF